MHPILIDGERFTLPTYGVVYLVAFLVSVWVGSRLAPRVGIPRARMIDAGFMMMIVGEVGSRLVFVIVEWDRVVSGGITLKQFLSGGRVVLGGIFAGFLFANWYIRRHGFLARDIADAAFTASALGMGIGRLGCWFGGCCYGKPTGLAWGTAFTDPSARQFNGTPLDVPLVPSQLVQAGAAFALFGVLLMLFRRRRYKGQIAGWFFVLSGVARFVTEFLRGDPRGDYLGLATSQWIAIGFVLFGVGWFRWTRRLAGLS